MPEDRTQEAKRRAGIAAARLVASGQVVGLGTGSTAAEAIAELGRRVREEELSIRGVPTSYQAAILARANRIPLTTLDDVDRVHVAIDGADEVDPDKNLIKGGGAAHTREKVIDSLAELFVVVVDEKKLVRRLGEACPVPVEVIPMALAPVRRALEALGGRPELRLGVRKDGPVVTDEGNWILDVFFPGGIGDPRRVERDIDTIPGVLECGLFVGVADRILIASPDSDEVRAI
ncbi:MAG: ribose-5-phosphate isomerase RpiA [Candidatus Eisenbacteria bacterium]